MSEGLAARLVALVGAANVIDDPAARAWYAHDIAGPAPHPAQLVVRPPSAEATVACVAAITEAGHPLSVRGGGHSYTGGYGPTRPGTVLLDMGALDRVVEINEADGWVTVEAGCTWRTLYDALAAVGRRTPFFGPLSGIVATVGGAASQNAAFFGSARHGPMSESVLGLDVVTTTGTLMRLGTVGEQGGAPVIARDFGPDMTGLFLGDCGAFGVKLRVTMRTLPVPAAVRFASFAFESFGAVIDAQIALAGAEEIAESYGFDAETHENLRRAGFTIGEGGAALRSVAKAEGGLARGVAAAVRTAAGVRRAVGETRNSLHLVLEGASEAAVSAAAGEVAASAARHGGVAIPDTIPRVTRSRPFRPLKSLLGPGGEAWLPMHGLLPPPARAPAWRRWRRVSRPRGTRCGRRASVSPCSPPWSAAGCCWSRSSSGPTRSRPFTCARSPRRSGRSSPIKSLTRAPARGFTTCVGRWSPHSRKRARLTTRSAPTIPILRGWIRASARSSRRSSARSTPTT